VIAGRLIDDAAVGDAAARGPAVADQRGGTMPAGSATVNAERVRQVLGAGELSWLVERIRGRLERGEPLDGTVTLVGATPAQRRAASRLLGHSLHRGTSLSVPLPEVAAVLSRSGVAPSLHAAVEALTGPVRHRAAERATEVKRWQESLAAARRSRLTSMPWYVAWLDQISRDGTLTRLVRREEGDLFRQAVAVLEKLPGSSEPAGMLLAELAEAVAGDAKALSGTPLAGLVLRALAFREEVPQPGGRDEERALWTAVGVVTDDLASEVLVLNVRCGGERLGRWLTEAAEAGEPFRVTLHQLTTMQVIPWALDMYVCESTAVLRAAAAQLGTASAPLVCTEGEPSVACRRLLHAAVATSTRLHWHTDFDWLGLRMTATAIRRLGAEPWLMNAADYRLGLDAGRSEPLRGQPSESPWDSRLAELMRSVGRAVPEDRLLPVLLGALAS
jgi:uncharacterized protein (TIGR02679 family)